MIRVMSFNLRTASVDDGEYAWLQRRERVRQLILDQAPDILGLQECRDDAQAVYLRAALPGYHWLAIRRGGAGDSALEMAPLLIREAAFECVDSGHFALSAAPQQIGSLGWDAHFARTASWARLRQHADGRELLALNTHFDYQPLALLHSAQLLRDWLAPQTLPKIVCGDFNALPDSAVHETLTRGSGLRDVLEAPAREPSYHGYGQAPEPGAIDWILVSPEWRVRQAQLLHPRPYASDHDPVLALLEG